MDKMQSLEALAALGHESRLEVFRLLVRCGEMGMLAGEISRALDIRQNTLSTHLAILQRACLVRSQREGRAIRYVADMDGMRGLLGFLMEDCCGGRLDLCQPLLSGIGGGGK